MSDGVWVTDRVAQPSARDHGHTDHTHTDHGQLHTLALHPRLISVAALVVLVVAAAVQVFVWGRAPAQSSGGALLPGLRGVFGTAYATVLLGLELVLCLLGRRRDTAAWVLVVAAVVDIVFWVAHAAGVHFAMPGAASMTAAFGAVAMAGSLWWRWPLSH